RDLPHREVVDRRLVLESDALDEVLAGSEVGARGVGEDEFEAAAREAALVGAQDRLPRRLEPEEREVVALLERPLVREAGEDLTAELERAFGVARTLHELLLLPV